MILVTGAAGFIGFHVVKRIVEDGHEVLGIDNLNDYYDPELKRARLQLLERLPGFFFEKIDISDKEAVESAFRKRSPEYVVHLAAQAGVRYSIINPRAYVDSNITGFLHVLEGCRTCGIKHLVYASSSSVYGLNTAMPFSVHHPADHPMSLYGATKKANELMAHSYCHLFGFPATGLRFFTVYGPWGRPDMAYFLFTKAILEGRTIDVFSHGKMLRDFTFIDDVTEAVVRILSHPPTGNPNWRGTNPDPASSTAPFRLYNIGNHTPIELARFISLIEECVGKKAIKSDLPAQAGDVPATAADVDDLRLVAGFEPKTPIEIGMLRFIDWYRSYYKV